MNIIGKSECTAEQMASYLVKYNPEAKVFALDYAKLYLEEGEIEGVRGDGAWVQSLKETHYFLFDMGTAVTFDQNNFCGMGVTRKGEKGNSFATPRLGIRAQIQHLKAYASKEPLKNECVDPRYKYVQKGIAPTFEDLSGRWAVPGYSTLAYRSLAEAQAAKADYGNTIITMIEKIKKEGGMVNVKEHLANSENYGNKRSVSDIKYIVIHYTANDGDSDENNGKYFANNVVKASAHYFVDSDSITQSVPDYYVAYSVGGNKYATGGRLWKICTNSNSISIELCDDVKNGVISPSQKTIDNALALTKSLMQKYNIPAMNVIRHYDVNGKPCPKYWVDDLKWREEFWNKLGSTETEVVTKSEFPFKVRITVDVLNYRSGPSTKYEVRGMVKKGQIYTIVDKNGSWGKLKSGAGWINIGPSYVEKVD